MTPLSDLETCSWCTEEVEDRTLVEMPDGARVCESCAPVWVEYECEGESDDDPFTMPEGWRYYTSRLAGNPCWEHLACGSVHVYVECRCDLAHHCAPRS